MSKNSDQNPLLKHLQITTNTLFNPFVNISQQKLKLEYETNIITNSQDNNVMYSADNTVTYIRWTTL